MTGVTVALSTTKAGELAQYTIQYTTSGAGTLADGAGQIIVQFPSGTTIPSSMSAGSISVTTDANISPSTRALTVAPVINAGTRTVNMTTPIAIGNGDKITVVFSTAAGLKNPITPQAYGTTASARSLIVKTSVDTTDASPATAYNITAFVSFSPVAGAKRGETVTVTGGGLAPSTTGSITVGASSTVQGTATIDSLGTFTGTFVAGPDTKDGGRVAVTDGAGALVSSDGAGCGVPCLAADTPLYVQKASATPRGSTVAAGSVLEIDLFDFTTSTNNVIANLGTTVGGVAVNNSPASSFPIPTGASPQFSPHKILIPVGTTTGTKNVVITESGGGGTKNATFQITVSAQSPGSLSLAPIAAVAGQWVVVTGSSFTPASTPGGDGPNGQHQITGSGTSLATLGGIPLPSTNLTYPIVLDSAGNFVAAILLPINSTTLSVGSTEIKMTDTGGKTGKINLTISGRTLTLNPDSSIRGSIVEATGAGFATGNLSVHITYAGELLATAIPNDDGSFKVNFEVPLTGAIPSANRVVASTTTDLVTSASATHSIPSGSVTVSPTSGPSGWRTTVTATNFPGFAVATGLTIAGIPALPGPAPSTDRNGGLVTLVLIPIAPIGAQSLVLTVGGVSAVASFTVTAAPPTEPVEVFADAIAADPGLRVWGFSQGTWQFFNAALPPDHPANDLLQVLAGDGIWIFNSTSATITTTILTRSHTLLPDWNLKGL